MVDLGCLVEALICQCIERLNFICVLYVLLLALHHSLLPWTCVLRIKDDLVVLRVVCVPYPRHVAAGSAPALLGGVK